MNIDGSTASTTRHVVAGLTNEIEYTFQIRAENQKGASSPSEPASATPIDLPDRPTGLIAGGGDQRVALVWDDSHYESITGYQYFQLVNQMSMAGSDSDVGERFADAVVMEGDTIVVSAGCHLTDEGDPAGGVYVFTRPSGGGSWVEETVKLTASDGALDDEFGLSIAIDGDTIVVGARQDRESGTCTGEGDPAGGVYVFTRPSGGGSWVEETVKLTASDGALDDEFGLSIAIDGDTIVVGARQDRESGTCTGEEDADPSSGHQPGPGAVYVFTKPPGGWVNANETAKLLAPGSSLSDSFGNSVAVDDDTIFVGAPDDAGNGVASGAVHVFTRPTDGWSDVNPVAKLTAPDGAASDHFGRVIAADGNTLVVGAPQDTHQTIASGSAYVFDKPDGGWVDDTETAKVTPSDPVA